VHTLQSPLLAPPVPVLVPPVLVLPPVLVVPPVPVDPPVPEQELVAFAKQPLSAVHAPSRQALTFCNVASVLQAEGIVPSFDEESEHC